ncbi:MAG: hypothetical protein D3903_19650, partial [Candidatus Electrothrix sp. GM3_4]|nr:hypothetical protein [Candidatus Electrothrix sp. GM3_4]
MNNSIVSGNLAFQAQGREIYTYVGGAVIAGSTNVFGHSGETDTEAFFGFTPGASDVVATSDGNQPTLLDAILTPVLKYNGGLTQTHALVTGSPVIDLDAACSSGLSTDQRGYSRPAGSGCDAGSFEFGALAPPSTDTDGDGVSDATDNCPLIANADQKDMNDDGIADACDICLNDPDNDKDKDGICGNIDNCIFIDNHDQQDTDGDSIGDACDPDDDNDGLSDASDNCPLVANADQQDTDGDSIG